MNIKTKKEISLDDWNTCVTEIYNRPYDFQQQDGCKERGEHYIKVPDLPEDYERETIKEDLNYDEMGVSFSAWLKRDPKQPLSEIPNPHGFELKLWWERKFYPNVQMIANDLHAKGILDAGEYSIDMDW